MLHSNIWVIEALESLLAKGYVRQAGLTEDGDPYYEPTPAGLEIGLREMEWHDETAA